MLPRGAPLLAGLVALALLPGCLNFLIPDDDGPPSAQFTVRVHLAEVESTDTFALNRSDLGDLLREGEPTTDLNGLVYVLDEAAAKSRPDGFVRVGEASWAAALQRFDTLCHARSSSCRGGATFAILWRGAPLQVTFERSLS